MIIPQYLEPGAYSTIIPNPTTASAAGPPIVCIVGEAQYGSYEPTMFYNSDDAQNFYGAATKSNPLPNGIQIAFENGAPQVLALNVQPTGSTYAYFNVPNSGLPGIPVATTTTVTSTFPISSYAPADVTLLDPVDGSVVNSDGTTAGIFYIQDFDPFVPDPVLNSSPTATSTTFANSQQNLLQYIQFTNAPLLNGVQQVPLQNTAMVKVIVPAFVSNAVPTATASLSSVLGPQPTQAQYNQFQNALTIMQAINSTTNSPVTATIIVPDFSNPTGTPANYRNMFELATVAVKPTSMSSPVLITNEADVYAYAINHGLLYITAVEAGKQHEIVAGLFATQSFDTQTGTLPFGLPVSVFAAINETNPCFFFNNGADGVVTTASFIDAINNQLTNVALDILVVLNTDTTLQSIIQDHVAFMSTTDERNERIALVSGGLSELYTTTIQNVLNIQTGSDPERMVYIWPTGGYRNDSVLNTSTLLDGTYIACACAGVLASNDAATPLTRKKIKGFTDITTKLSNKAANAIAQYGVCIIENNPTVGLRVRDGITCDPSTPESQEISVVRQLDYCAQTIRDLLDLNVVATKITTNTLAVVQTLTTNGLQALVNNDIIYGYQNVSARINPNDPRQIDVRFTVRPAYPCKYVMITISVTSSLNGFSTTSSTSAS